MADLSCDIDPGGTGDYLTLAAFEAAQGQDLTDGGGDTMTANCFSSDGSDDTSACLINGFVTSVTNYLKIIGTDFPSDGVFDATKYLITADDSWCIYSQEAYVKIENIQAIPKETGGAAYGFLINTGSGRLDIDSCFLKGDCAGTGGCYGINTTGADTVNVYNTVVKNIAGTTGHRAYFTDNSGSTMNIYNCVAHDNYYSYWGYSGTMNVYNSAGITGSVSVFTSCDVIDYCISAGGDGTNAQTPKSGDFDAEYPNLDSDDYTPASDGNSVGNGTDDPSSGLYSDDIAGTARSSTWDIGAWEYVSAGGDPGIMTTNSGYWGPTYNG
jgi:hypothetical protein